jgi:hypothetical protein
LQLQQHSGYWGRLTPGILVHKHSMLGTLEREDLSTEGNPARPCPSSRRELLQASCSFLPIHQSRSLVFLPPCRLPTETRIKPATAAGGLWHQLMRSLVGDTEFFFHLIVFRGRRTDTCIGKTLCYRVRLGTRKRDHAISEILIFVFEKKKKRIDRASRIRLHMWEPTQQQQQQQQQQQPKRKLKHESETKWYRYYGRAWVGRGAGKLEASECYGRVAGVVRASVCTYK